MAGAWDTPDLATLLELGALNEASLGRMLRMSATVRALLALRHRLRANSRRGSRRNIAYHYDLGNDFYRLWLDPGMTYSSAVFETGAETLEAAQQAKYRRLIGLLDLGPDDHVLEIGCGWGGFATEAVRSTGCRVTGVTLSREQLAWARDERMIFFSSFLSIHSPCSAQRSRMTKGVSPGRSGASATRMRLMPFLKLCMGSSATSCPLSMTPTQSQMRSSSCTRWLEMKTVALVSDT